MFESKAVRYGASFLVVVLIVAAGTLAAVAVPHGFPYRALVETTLILAAAVLGVYAMLRIEEGPGPFARRLP